MDLKQLEAFRAISMTGSFRAAAIRLGVTQSALTHRIKKLEEELGETLLIRAKPRVYPSPAGHRLATSADRVLEELNALKEEFTPTKRGQLTGQLRVAASNLGIVYLYGHLYEEFIKKYPGVELILTATETPLEGVRQVVSGTVDVAFTPFPIDFPNLEAVTLGSTEHVLIVGRNHPLAGFKAVTVEAVKQFPFVRYQPSAGTRQVTDQIFLSAGGYPPILTESNDTEFIKRIVGMGLGVALVPSFTVSAEVRTGKLKPLRFSNMKLIQEFGFVHRREVKMRVLEVFKGLCIEKGCPGPSLVLQPVTRRLRRTRQGRGEDQTRRNSSDHRISRYTKRTEAANDT